MKVRQMIEIPAGEVKKILVRALNRVGDAVLITPSLTALKKIFPAA
jgi:ADP-heptose:LPS heptosyltransferase